jgi:hypothetical protein
VKQIKRNWLISILSIAALLIVFSTWLGMLSYADPPVPAFPPGPVPNGYSGSLAVSGGTLTTVTTSGNTTFPLSGGSLQISGGTALAATNNYKTSSGTFTINVGSLSISGTQAYYVISGGSFATSGGTAGGTVSTPVYVSGNSYITSPGTAAQGNVLSGVNSFPCRQVVLSTTTTGSFVGSSTGSCPVPIPANSPLTLTPANVSEIYILNSGSGTINWVGF